MKNVLKLALIVAGLASAVLPNVSIAKEVQLDKVVAIVNTGVVLESEIQNLINQVKSQALSENQSLPSDKALRTQATEKLINDTLILELGERMGVQITDQQLDAAIVTIAQNGAMSVDQLRDKILTDGIAFDSYRESIRNEMIINEVRRASVRRRISITPQEVDNLLKLMKEQTSQDIEYRIGHILIAFPDEPTQDDINDAKSRAEKVIQLLNDGSDFKKIAIASSGASSALEGGDLGWRGINEMPTLFAELVDGKRKEEVFGPVRTGLGFNIVKILDIRGKETVEVTELKSRHILIKPSIILSEEKAEKILQGFLDDIAAGEADFAELAKEHSEGPTSARGGDLGWADPSSYDPAFKAVLESLEIDEYSKPFRSSFGWHIAQLTGKRIQDATDENDSNRAYQLLFNRKFGVEAARWLKESRDEAYIEILDASSD